MPEADDGSCLYLGGRGLTTRAWSAMTDRYKLDDWWVLRKGLNYYFSIKQMPV